MQVVGRNKEVELLQGCLKSNQAELVVVHGRRRIGKTYLIGNLYEKNIAFELTGMYNVSLSVQLENFYFTLNSKRKQKNRPKSWVEAFHQLSVYLNGLKSKKKKVIFIDEFPWLDSRKSNFLPAFENFWNSYAAKRSDLIVVVCGSAASYMVKKILHSKGGLYNRLTQKIHLKAFNLHETELLLKRNKVNYTRYDILLLYMILGGVPKYLELLTKGESVAQAIDRLCFSEQGILRTEFSEIFSSLYTQSYNHIAVVRALAKVRKGLTRNEIIAKSKVKSGGTISKTLMELEQSGFIERYEPLDGVKRALYRLTDEYSLFYLKYIEGQKPEAQTWLKLQVKNTFKAWAGYTFESVCIKHIAQIKNALNILGVHTTHGSWIERDDNGGSQIDLLINRDDNVINVCEMKFYRAPFTIDKKYAKELERKVGKFVESTKEKKNVWLTFITSNGLTSNGYSKQLVQSTVEIDDLFENL